MVHASAWVCIPFRSRSDHSGPVQVTADPRRQMLTRAVQYGPVQTNAVVPSSLIVSTLPLVKPKMKQKRKKAGEFGFGRGGFFGVQGFGFSVYGSGFRVEGVGFRV